MGHPEVGSERVRRLLCRDLQRRQQAQTLHGHRHDWLPRAGLAGEGAGAFELKWQYAISMIVGNVKFVCGGIL